MATTIEVPRRILWGAGTPRTMRAHWILHELGLSYERRPFGPRTGETQTVEFTKLNPRQKIPVLQDGDFTLAESAAIVTYLVDTYGTSQDLVPQPAGTRERALYYQWCFYIMTELDAHTLYIIRKHSDLKEIFGEAPNALRAAREGFLKQVGVAAQAPIFARPLHSRKSVYRRGHSLNYLPHISRSPRDTSDRRPPRLYEADNLS
jgi:glutathione S-transferase